MFRSKKIAHFSFKLDITILNCKCKFLVHKRSSWSDRSIWTDDSHLRWRKAPKPKCTFSKVARFFLWKSPSFRYKRTLLGFKFDKTRSCGSESQTCHIRLFCKRLCFWSKKQKMNCAKHINAGNMMLTCFRQNCVFVCGWTAYKTWNFGDKKWKHHLAQTEQLTQLVTGQNATFRTSR